MEVLAFISVVAKDSRIDLYGYCGIRGYLRGKRGDSQVRNGFYVNQKFSRFSNEGGTRGVW